MSVCVDSAAVFEALCRLMNIFYLFLSMLSTRLSEPSVYEAFMD